MSDDTGKSNKRLSYRRGTVRQWYITLEVK